MPDTVQPILVAPDSFKECLSSEAVARCLGEGIQKASPEVTVRLFPVADGGEGTASCIAFHLGGTWKELTVHDPLHRPMRARYLVLEGRDTAVIELAAASGLELLTGPERDPLRASTRGTGELLRDALDSGMGTIILAVGGSATVDGGVGLATALGFRFLDAAGRDLAPSGAMTAEAAAIDVSGIHPRLGAARIVMASDVRNVLNGPEGAARVYAAQKGADEDGIRRLEEGLSRLSALVFRETGFDTDRHPGTGAAGGAGLFLLAYGRAVIRSGFETLAEWTGFDAALGEARAVVTGEGRIDAQTAFGKVVAAVAEAAAARRKPLVLVGGIIEGDRETVRARYGATAVHALMDHASGPEDSIRNARRYLRRIGEEIPSDFRREP